VVCAIAGRDATRAPLAIAHDTANGNDFNLNVMDTSPSRISLKVVFIDSTRFRVFPVSLEAAGTSFAAVYFFWSSCRTNSLN
jgi:hypothetical protein